LDVITSCSDVITSCSDVIPGYDRGSRGHGFPIRSGMTNPRIPDWVGNDKSMDTRLGWE
jgi:hypothetical protein